MRFEKMLKKLYKHLNEHILSLVVKIVKVTF